MPITAAGWERKPIITPRSGEWRALFESIKGRPAVTVRAGGAGPNYRFDSSGLPSEKEGCVLLENGSLVNWWPGSLVGTWLMTHRSEYGIWTYTGILLIRWEREYWVTPGAIAFPTISGAIYPINQNNFPGDGGDDPEGIGKKNHYYFCWGKFLVLDNERCDDAHPGSYNVSVTPLSYTEYLTDMATIY